MERIFDSPRRVRFVAANVAASDTVKGSHIQRNPLSMGALAEPEGVGSGSGQGYPAPQGKC